MTVPVLALLVTLAGVPRAPAPAPGATATATSASSMPATAPAPTPRKEARLIPLDESQARVFHTVLVHPSIPAVLEFPEAFASMPTCGDCIDVGAPSAPAKPTDALFAVQVFAQDSYVTIKPAQLAREEGGAVPMADFLTTFTVRLQSHLTVTLRIQYGTLEQADARVAFTLPHREQESAYVREELAKQLARQEAAFATKLEERATDLFLRRLAEPHQCAPSSARARSEDIVVEAREVCRYGSTIYLVFSVENAARQALFDVESVEVLRKDDKPADPPLPDLRYVLTQSQLDFRQMAVGTAGFPAEPGVSSYQLRIRERGGRNRVVLLAGLSL